MPKFSLYFQIAVGAGCVMFFVADVIHDMVVDAEYTVHFYIEACFAILLSIVVAAQFVQLLVLRKNHLELIEKLNESGNDLHRVVEAQFARWNLSTSEYEVATLVFKGFSASEIADLRGTAVGTVKAQMSAIYRKADVKNLAELLMVVIDRVYDDR